MDSQKHMIPLMDPMIKGLNESAAVGAFLENLCLPAVILSGTRHDEWMRFLHVNSAMCDLCGFGTEELIGETFELLSGEDTEMGDITTFRRELMDVGSGFSNLLYYRKNGTPFEVFMLGTRVKYTRAGGGGLYCILIYHLHEVKMALPRPPIQSTPNSTH